MTLSATRSERVRGTVLLAYGALGFPLAVLNLPLYVYLPTFYAEQMGLGLATVGIMLFAARLLDTLSDPLIGELSDRIPIRFGRRRPWLRPARIEVAANPRVTPRARSRPQSSRTSGPTA